jgi:hypothetical protein
VLELNIVGMVDITNVIDGDPPLQFMAKARSKMLMEIPPLQIDGKGEVEGVDGDPSAPKCRWQSLRFRTMTKYDLPFIFIF